MRDQVKIDPAHEEAQVFVTLRVDGQLCGIPVLSVRDVLAASTIARIPLARSEIAGSINLRGRIVTAIDVRERLGLPPCEAGQQRMSIVTELGGEYYALVVDQVEEVLSVELAQFERKPPTLAAAWAEFGTGIYRLSERLMVVLDIRKLLDLQLLAA